MSDLATPLGGVQQPFQISADLLVAKLDSGEDLGRQH